MAAERVTQVGVEALVSPGTVNARVTQIGVEALVLPPNVNLRATLIAVEVLVPLSVAADDTTISVIW